MFFTQRGIRSFHVAVLQRKAEKCTKNYNARAQLLFCSLNLLFSDVSVACRRGFLKTLMLAIEGDNTCFIKEKAPSFFFNS